MTARIYELDRGVSIWFWLCLKHLAKRKREGWEEKSSKEPPHPLHCDDCMGEAMP